jgi:RNA 2',3'-cyclic 3'-phosphodiesterase
MGRTRVFMGLELSGSVRGKLSSLQTQLGKTGATVKWVEPANMHLTLLFLGELDDQDLALACRLATKAITRVPTFSLTATGVGAFPTVRRPKILWAGVEDSSGQLHKTFTRLEQSLAMEGLYRTEDRPYTPHLTLGRVADEPSETALSVELPKYCSWHGGTWEIDELAIFSSDTTRNGPMYNVIGRAAFGDV